MPTTFRMLDLAWFAGMMEGEGWYSYPGRTPCVGIGSTDRDVIDRISRLVRCPAITRKKEASPLSKKPVHMVSFYGTLAVQWMMTLYPMMGERRRGQILKVIDRWKAAPGKGNWRGRKPGSAGYEEGKAKDRAECR